MNPIPLLYFVGIIWALGTSTKRWRTLGWMAASLLFTWVSILLIAFVVYQGGFPPGADFGRALAAMFALPSLAVPAVVGVIHAWRNKKLKSN